MALGFSKPKITGNLTIKTLFTGAAIILLLELGYQPF